MIPDNVPPMTLATPFLPLHSLRPPAPCTGRATGRKRNFLAVAVSSDARNWQAALVLESEPGECSDPAVIQTSGGLAHAVYTWKRQRIQHVVIDPAKLVLREMAGGKWPA
jgi:predicted neuraminidase